MQHFSVLLTLLQNRDKFIEEIHQGVKIKKKIIALLISSSIFFAIYGAIIGAFSSWLQVLSSAVKLPALYLITIITCFPTLYFFNILFGLRQTFGQQFAFVLTAVSITSVLQFSFAPVALFFLITITDYQFFQLLNVGIFAITGFVGVSSFYQVMKPISKADDEDNKANEERNARTSILQLWLILYAFVGSQLAWTLRPFFGAPGFPFELFRDREGNFYLSVFKAIIEIFSF